MKAVMVVVSVVGLSALALAKSDSQRMRRVVSTQSFTAYAVVTSSIPAVSSGTIVAR